MTLPRGDLLAFILVALVGGLIAVASACGALRGPPPAPPGPVTFADQERALKIVWQDMFGMDPALAPQIVWVRHDQLNCANGNGWKVKPIPPNIPGCVAGLYVPDLNMAMVAWPREAWSVSDTAFAHELAHALFWYYYGSSDAPHASELFAPGGLVEKANAALKAVGL